MVNKMAHEIAKKANGQDAMAFVGSRANVWHGLGQQLTEDASIDTWKTEAGLDWNAKSVPVQYAINAAVHSFKGRKVIYREDTGAALSVVSDAYKIVQPGVALEFFRNLTEENHFTMETAGCLFGGKKVWALAKTGKSVKLRGVDEIKPYLLMATSLDGSMATVAHFTATRPVCDNTLRMAIGANGASAKVRIHHNTDFEIASAQKELGIANQAWDNFITDCEKMIDFKLDRDLAIDVIAQELKDSWKNEQGDEMSRVEMMQSSAILKKNNRIVRWSWHWC